jgi:hypothetical protein
MISMAASVQRDDQNLLNYLTVGEKGFVTSSSLPRSEAIVREIATTILTLGFGT